VSLIDRGDFETASFMPFHSVPQILRFEIAVHGKEPYKPVAAKDGDYGLMGCALKALLKFLVSAGRMSRSWPFAGMAVKVGQQVVVELLEPNQQPVGKPRYWRSRHAGSFVMLQLNKLVEHEGAARSRRRNRARAHEVAPEASIELNQDEHQRQKHSREQRKALFEAVRAAHQRGVTRRAIALEFGISLLTIRRYLQAKEFPQRAARQRGPELDSFRGYLEQRWAEGCRNASQLCRKLRNQGYSGHRSRLKEYLQPWPRELVVDIVQRYGENSLTCGSSHFG
jgi:hypothetical protein